MFQDVFAPYIERARPHAIAVGHEARACAERIIARLDRIADAVEVDERVYYRERPMVSLLAGARDESVVIPGGEWWVLETVTIAPTGAVGTPGSVTIYNGLQPIFGAPHAGRPTTVGGNSVRLEPGWTLRISANETGADVVLQCRVERQHPAHPKGIGGIREVGPEPGLTPPNPEIDRHHGNWSTRAVA